MNTMRYTTAAYGRYSIPQSRLRTTRRRSSESPSAANLDPTVVTVLLDDTLLLHAGFALGFELGEQLFSLIEDSVRGGGLVCGEMLMLFINRYCSSWSFTSGDDSHGGIPPKVPHPDA